MLLHASAMLSGCYTPEALPPSVTVASQGFAVRGSRTKFANKVAPLIRSHWDLAALERRGLQRLLAGGAPLPRGDGCEALRVGLVLLVRSLVEGLLGRLRRDRAHRGERRPLLRLRAERDVIGRRLARHGHRNPRVGKLRRRTALGWFRLFHTVEL
jgi:hypothetical protein